MDLYAQNILDRYKKPFFKSGQRSAVSGQQDHGLSAPRSSLVFHKEANHSCGDIVEIEIELEEGKIKNYQFTGAGCAISMAAADMLGDLIVGMSVDEVVAISKEEIYEILGIEISVRRSKCALLGLLAIQNGLLLHQKKEQKTWKDYYI